MTTHPHLAAALLGLAVAACGGAGGTPEAAAAVSVAISPPSARVAPGASVAFTSLVTGTLNTTVTWSIQETTGGTIDPSGVYTAPGANGTYHVLATSNADPTKRGTAAVTVTPSGGGSTGKWVTGYYAHWMRSDYPVSKVDWTALTHLTVATVGIDAGGALYNPMPDGVDTNKWACDIVAAAHAHNVKAILMIGGAASASDYQMMTGNAAYRARFVSEVVNWGLKPPAQGGCGFDGVDLDWEPLSLPGDGTLLVKLASDFRAAWPGLLITVPVGWDGDNPWWGTAHQNFDQINMMTYAMSGDWGGWKSWYHSALYGDDSAGCNTGSGCNHPSSVSAVIKWMRDDGVPASKLGIGIGFYGTVWSGGSPPVTAPLQTISSGVFCDRDSDNVNTYAYIMSQYYTAAAYHWDDTAKVGYLSYPGGHGPARATWVSYEDAASIAAKGQFVKDQGLGGTIIWLLQHGCTNPTTGENPPLAAVKAAFLQ